MKSLKTNKATLFIDPKVYLKMSMLVQIINNELAWHGFIIRLNDSEYLWYDIEMYPQYNTSVTSESEEDEYGAWLEKKMEQENFQDIRLHGHSHVNMSCSPSGTDNKYRQDIVANLKENDFYFFIIVNKKGEMNVQLYDKKLMLRFDDSDIDIVKADPNQFDEALKWAKESIKENVKERERNYLCSTTSKALKSSTPKNAKNKYMSSDAALLEAQYQNCWFD